MRREGEEVRIQVLANVDGLDPNTSVGWEFKLHCLIT